MNLTSYCRLLWRKTTESTFVTTLSNQMWVSDVIRVIDGAFKTPHKPGWIMTVILPSVIQLTRLLYTQTWCRLSRFWKLLMVGHGNRREWAGWGKVRKSDRIYQKPVYKSTRRWLPGGSTVLWYTNVLYHLVQLATRGSEIMRDRTMWMQIIIRRNISWMSITTTSACSYNW
jgi:hypothetical protein